MFYFSCCLLHFIKKELFSYIFIENNNTKNEKKKRKKEKKNSVGLEPCSGSTRLHLTTTPQRLNTEFSGKVFHFIPFP